MSIQSPLIKSAKSLGENRTVHGIFSDHAKQSDRHAKLVYLDQNISYATLNKISEQLAVNLLRSGVETENLVAILMERSIDTVTSQLGILKAGAAYLPLAPADYPIERIKNIFEDAQVGYVVSQKKHQGLIEELKQSLGSTVKCFYVDEQQQLAANEASLALLETVTVDPDNLAYVMYTSGSTGKPKGVMITHQNIISSVIDTNYFDVHSNDTILHAAPISFDAATFEIWAALLNNIDLHIVPETLVRDFKAFSKHVRRHPISIAWLTSALFNLLCDTRPEFFEFLSQVMVGGEALSPKHIQKIRARYPHLKIRNNYGPTENTIFSTSFLIDKDYKSSIPIGQEISHKRAYILDDNLEKVPAFTPGTLYVAGAGLARGYLNMPEETAQKFIADPFYKGERMYFTGDLCQYNGEGEIDYIGRMDDQIKVLGHRIELGEIESVLRSCPDVNNAVVLHKKLAANTKGIAAYLDYNEGDWPRIKRYIDTKLPQYMLPHYVERLDQFPITINGKLDRKQIQDWPVKTLSKLNCTEQSATKPGLESTVLSTCQTILELSDISSSQNFFELGGDSLSGTSFMIELEQQLQQELPLHLLYESPCLNDLIQRIESILSDDKDAQGKNHSAVQEAENLRGDAQLNFDIDLKERHTHIPPNLAEQTSNIFLTGATGFFGAFLLKELLASSKASIHCLVRANNTTHAQERIYNTLEKYRIELSSAEKMRIVGIPGDLTQENLGLSQEDFNHLATTTDLIIHNGAVVNYVDSYATLKKPNVFGSQEVLRLASDKRLIPLHYISSISVFETLGFFTGREKIYEHEGVEASEHYVRLGYSQSKWVAEKMMLDARDLGLPITIYRSAYIMGHSKTGVSNTTDHIARYIAGCIEMGCAPILDECASLTPVDQLAQALSHIVVNQPLAQKTFHMCNPNFISVSDIYQKIQDFGFPLELISYSQWKSRFTSVPSTNPLYPLLSLHIHSAPRHNLTLPELYERNMRFDCSQFLDAIEGSGIEIKLTDPAIFERWLHYYLEAGLISKETFALTQAPISQQHNR